MISKAEKENRDNYIAARKARGGEALRLSKRSAPAFWWWPFKKQGNSHVFGK